VVAVTVMIEVVRGCVAGWPCHSVD